MSEHRITLCKCPVCVCKIKSKSTICKDCDDGYHGKEVRR